MKRTLGGVGLPEATVGCVAAGSGEATAAVVGCVTGGFGGGGRGGVGWTRGGVRLLPGRRVFTLPRAEGVVCPVGLATVSA